MKSGNLKFLEPSGPLQASNGTALPFLQIYVTYSYITYNDTSLTNKQTSKQTSYITAWSRFLHTAVAVDSREIFSFF